MAIEIDLGKRGSADFIVQHYASHLKSSMKMAVIEAMRQLTISTPVDTGRARWGWFCTVNAFSGSVPDEVPDGWQGKSSGGTPFFQQPDVISRVQEIGDYQISDTLYITNNVSYIVKLNGGSSRQAPARFVEKAAANAGIAVERFLKSKQG